MQRKRVSSNKLRGWIFRTRGTRWQESKESKESKESRNCTETQVQVLGDACNEPRLAAIMCGAHNKRLDLLRHCCTRPERGLPSHSPAPFCSSQSVISRTHRQATYENYCSYFFTVFFTFQLLLLHTFYSSLAVPGMRCNATRKPPSRSPLTRPLERGWLLSWWRRPLLRLFAGGHDSTDLWRGTHERRT
jgi:hypothetical protein